MERVMPDPAEQEIIAEIAREQVAELAPDELPLFRPTSEAYFKDPDKTLKPQSGRDEVLGFGAQAALTFLTPIVLAVVTEVVTFLVAEIGKSLKEEGRVAVGQIVKGLFKRFRGPDAPATPAPAIATLTPDQLAQVRKVAYDKARTLNLTEDRAALLADALVGSLAVSG
jgi:hypothetical protein